MKKILEIKQDAIFIADSHTQCCSQNGRDSLIFVLEKMLDSAPSQIFLLGDISNILVGNLKSSIKSNQRLISAIDSLTQKAQIIYFEGNHDFNLECIMPSVIKIPRKNQPQLAHFGDKTALIAHGDIFLDKKYEIYIKILSAKSTAKILNAMDLATFGRLYGFIEKKVQNKKIRLLRDESAIHALIQRRIQSYENYMLRQNLCVDFVIEGHFHLGKIIKKNALNSTNPRDSKCDSIDFTNRTKNSPDSINQNFSYIALPSFYPQNLAFRIANCDFVRL